MDNKKKNHRVYLEGRVVGEVVRAPGEDFSVVVIVAQAPICGYHGQRTAVQRRSLHDDYKTRLEGK